MSTANNEDKTAALRELEIHKSKRKVTRAAITRDVKKAAEQFADVTTTNALDAHVLLTSLEAHQKLIGEFDEYIVRYGTDTANIAQEVERSMEYQSALLSAVTRLKAQIHAFEAANANVRQTAQPTNSKSPVKTPKLQLTSFNGDPLRWEEFWDDFTCSIDSRSDLSTIDKFKILKQSLHGEALDVADGYFLTQSNYEEVKSALKERFGDPQVAIHAHFLALMEMKQASHDVVQLVKMRDCCEAHIRSLVGLGVSEDTFGVVFAPLILSKLPRFVRMELNRLNGSNKWTLQKLRELLRVEITARTRSDRSFGGGSHQKGSDDEVGRPAESSMGPNRTQQPKKNLQKGTVTALMVQTGKGKKSDSSKWKPKECAFCKGAHGSWDCRKYPTTDARLSQMNGRCYRCLSKNHQVAECRASGKCYYCGKTNHCSSLCYVKFGFPTHRETAQICQSQPLNPAAPEFVAHAASALSDELSHPKQPHAGMAVLGSAQVFVKGCKAGAMVRMVFDNASTTTLIRRKLSKEIGATSVGDVYTALGRVGEGYGRRDKYPKVKLLLQLKDGSFMEIIAREIETVAPPLKLVPVDTRFAERHVQPSELAQLCVDKPTEAEVDILLGLNHYYNLVGTEVCRGDNGLVVKSTKVGHILSGFVENSPGEHGVPNHNMLLLDYPDKQVQDVTDLERFWRLEDIGIVDKPDLNDDDVALASFNNSVKFVDGRYSVKFPFKTEWPEIPDNRELALARLRSTYRRLEDDPSLLEAYDQIFTDQLEKLVIEEAPVVPSGVVHYVPHHAVVTPGKVTTKVRVVFDASAKATKSSQSLNDSMYRGPVFLNDLCGLLMRFRLPAKVVTTDVEKAFLQVRLDETHRDCTRFFWLRDLKKPPVKGNLVIYRYARVPFGMKASPFLLAATIIHHMRKVGTPKAREIERSTYMDNVICGCVDTEDALKYYHETKQLFMDMSMNLREWYCNDSTFMETIPELDRGKSSEPSVLGVRWCPEEDSIHCTVGSGIPEEPTKRSILKLHASVFDPCGWFSPVIVQGKVLMQELWRDNYGWDDQLKSETAVRWAQLASDLVRLPQFKLPRLCSQPLHNGTPHSIELHAFCDASCKAYAACVYLRVSSDEARSDLVFAKVRVAPLKKLTIPKLELMAVTVGSRVLSFVESQLHLPITSKYLWTDSMCVIGWLQRSKVTSVFVENRLKELRKRSDVQFRFVKTHDNPADLPTRGMSLDDLWLNRLWWYGPVWLTNDPTSWPQRAQLQLSANDEEAANVVQEESRDIVDGLFDLTRYSSLYKLLRVTCYVLRAIDVFRHPVGSHRGPHVVDATSLQAASTFWEKRTQKLHYNGLLTSLPQVNHLNNKERNMVHQLGLFVDKDGLIRCRGRYQNSRELSPTAKFPKLLPPDSRFSELVIKKYHERVLHSGPKHTLAMLRTHYWLPKGRSKVRSVLLSCRVCRRWSGGPFEAPPESTLPGIRVSVQRPFDSTGIDYIGPLQVREDTTRKVWIVLFACAVTRAVHLEVVNALSAAEFLMALRRFMAVYQCPKNVVSDNATQFKLADQILARLWREAQSADVVQTYANSHGIQWHFIVEKAPWMGRFYERLVALVKTALKKTIGTWSLTSTELTTVVYEVAHVLNSRPLVYSEDDPTETVLTPAHLLFKAQDMFPEADEDYDPQQCVSKAGELLAHWKAGQSLLRSFWQVWRDQYLLSLREYWRPLHDRATSQLKPVRGAVVLIKDALPRGMWKVGRITNLKVSADGKLRSAEVTLPGGSKIMRPLRLLYPLECGEGQISQGEPGPHGHVTPGGAPMQRAARAAARDAMAKIKKMNKD